MEWLMNMLGAGQGAGAASPASFGQLGSGGTGVGAGAGVNNGMPMSGLGAGPDASVAPAPAGGQPVGLLGQLAQKFGLGGGAAPGGAPGSAPAGNGGAAPNTNILGGQRGGGQAMNVAQNLLKSKPLQPAQFNWMKLPGING